MKKKILAGFLIALMVLTLAPAYAYADLNSDLEDINNQKDQVSNDMAELEDSLEKQKAELDEIEAAVSAKEAEIADSEAEIQATKEKIEQTKKDIEKREKELGLRLRTMYKNGSVGYIDVILGSGSLSEFLSNVSMVQRLYRSDQEIMEELEKQQQLLEQQYAELERQQAALEEEKKALSAKQSEAEEKKASMPAPRKAPALARARIKRAGKEYNITVSRRKGSVPEPGNAGAFSGAGLSASRPAAARGGEGKMFEGERKGL